MPTQSSPNLADLLRMLNAATDRNALQWNTTAEENSFRADTHTGLVRVSRNPSEPLYTLSLIDQGGIVMDEFRPSGEDEIAALDILYKKARVKALNLDWKLKGLYDYLKTLAGEP